ncbi:MAG: RNA methyltransferase [Phycisphaerales bacterium]|nr:RNA methyltransferase [Phycisphaerales bacterium]
MPLIPITSTTDPRLADYLDIREQHLRAGSLASREGAETTFIAEGEVVVRQLIKSSFQTRSVLLTESRLATVRDALDALPPTTPRYVIDQALMNSVVGFNIHRGLLAVGIRRRLPTLDELLAGSHTLVVLEDLANHDNLGAMFRNAAALGGAGCSVLLSPRCADPLYRKALRVSVGLVLMVPFTRSTDFPGDLARIRAAGFQILALTPAAGAIDIGYGEEGVPSSPTGKRAILIGAEGPGLTEAARRSADLSVRIPIAPGVDSINAALAGGIALHRLTPPPD